MPYGEKGICYTYLNGKKCDDINCKHTHKRSLCAKCGNVVSVKKMCRKCIYSSYDEADEQFAGLVPLAGDDEFILSVGVKGGDTHLFHIPRSFECEVDGFVRRFPPKFAYLAKHRVYVRKSMSVALANWRAQSQPKAQPEVMGEVMSVVVSDDANELKTQSDAGSIVVSDAGSIAPPPSPRDASADDTSEKSYSAVAQADDAAAALEELGA